MDNIPTFRIENGLTVKNGAKFGVGFTIATILTSSITSLLIKKTAPKINQATANMVEKANQIKEATNNLNNSQE